MITTEEQKKLDEILISSIQKLGIDFYGRDITSKFEMYMKKLLEYNSHTNLTAITDPLEIYIKHFVDSVSAILAFEYIKEKDGIDYTDKKIIDVGTGAGFPSIPVKIIREELNMVLLDSLKKRIKFLEGIKSELDFKNLTLLHARAEDAAREIDKREKFDFVLSRAVANLPTLIEYCMPFLKKGGYMVCLKGPSINEEIEKSKKALEVLGGKLEHIIAVDIPYSDLKHQIAIFKKIKSTDKKYPRKAGTPQKEPIV